MFLNKLLSFKQIFNQSAYSQSNIRSIHSTFSCYRKDEVMRSVRQSTIAKRDQGTEGESTISIDSLAMSQDEMFPTENTPNMLFNGIQFSKIPICNIKVTKNNTLISLNDPVTGKPEVARTCGTEGFKNTRKGTNIAAQQTAISFGTICKRNGFETVRVRIRGLGPGRISAIKGLEMSGLNIVSVTDNTPVSDNPPRPRKQRRL